MTDDFFAVVERQRACRAFSTEPVDDDTIARVLSAATFAPSAENKQPW
jgi:nitroreductase